MKLKEIKPCNISVLESSIKYKFINIKLLHEALRHSSFVNEHLEKLKDNERLEFLGDSVLNFVITDLLIRYYPELNEGDLSRIRANLVNEVQLSVIAKSINLGSYLYLGKGEIQTKGRNKNSILANALEAIIAAVYLDGGIDSSFILVRILFHEFIKVIDITGVNVDYKSKLQEKAQVFYHKVPTYVVIGESGPDHNKSFEVSMTIGSIVSHGRGGSKKAAEQLAAREGLELLMKQR